VHTILESRLWHRTVGRGPPSCSSALALNARPLQVAPTAQQIEAYFDALAKTPFGNIYADDGAGDGTVTQSGELVDSGPLVRPVQAVRAIVDLRAGAIPILVAHLDDERATTIVFAGKLVRLGHLALDILTHIVGRTNRVFVSHCADDGLGACIQRGFYFRPDASAEQMSAVKAVWQIALKRGSLQFVYPRWWAK